MTQFPTYHDPFAANIPPAVTAIGDQALLPFLCDGGNYVQCAAACARAAIRQATMPRLLHRSRALDDALIEPAPVTGQVLDDAQHESTCDGFVLIVSSGASVRAWA